MDKIKAIISQHKKASLLALFALIIFIGFSATSAIDVAHRRAAEESAKTESIEKQDSFDDGDDAEKKVELSSSQKKLIDGYDDDTKKLIETLSASVFSANNGRNTLRFHGDYYMETVNGKEEQHPYAISAVEFGSNGSDSEIDRIVFETDTGTHIATFTLVISADNAAAGECTIASTSMFALTDMPYERKDVVREINVTGLNSEITELLGDTAEMKKELSDWCSIHYPVATTATWIGTCNIDYDKGIVSTAFTIGDGKSDTATGNTGASVSVSYDRSEKSYNFSM